MGAVKFLDFVQPKSFCGTFLFHGVAWRFTLLLALDENSTDCLRNTEYGFTYFYGFCVHLCTTFAHVVLLLCTYMNLLLRKLCGFCLRIRLLLLHKLCRFCVRIRLLCALCRFFVRIRLIFTVFNVDSLKGPDSEGSVDLFFRLKCLFNVHSYEGSNLEGSVDLFSPHELLVIHRPNSLEVSLLVLI